jgi:hypothetical protein
MATLAFAVVTGRRPYTRRVHAIATSGAVCCAHHRAAERGRGPRQADPQEAHDGHRRARERPEDLAAESGSTDELEAEEELQDEEIGEQ